MLELIATPGLIWVVLVTFTAGVIYGFAGFGSALIYMPVAAAVLEPALAIGAFSVSALASIFTLVPRAWEQADQPNVVVMTGAAVIFAPLGIWVLVNSDTTMLRWVLCGITAATLLLLMSGWRYRVQPTKYLRATIGAAAGVMMGSVGLNGPLVILFQLSGQDSVTRSRANTLIFLTFSSLSLLPLMALQGVIGWPAVGLGLLLLVPYGLGTLAGRRFFDPDREKLYRQVAYLIIAASAIMGLPLWT
ncbi:MAG: sulfite exporter TauE/SafE family protein [Pseudomonadota bacterium]